MHKCINEWETWDEMMGKVKSFGGVLSETNIHNTHFQLIKKFHPYTLKWEYKILLEELKGCSILGDQEAYLTEGLESF